MNYLRRTIVEHSHDHHDLSLASMVVARRTGEYGLSHRIAYDEGDDEEFHMPMFGC
jgi:ribosomal protein L32